MSAKKVDLVKKIIAAIQLIVNAQKVSLLESTYQFILQNQNDIEKLELADLIALRNYFNHSFESLVFFIALLEFAKVTDKALFRPFTLFTAHHLLTDLSQVKSFEISKKRQFCPKT